MNATALEFTGTPAAWTVLRDAQNAAASKGVRVDRFEHLEKSNSLLRKIVQQASDVEQTGTMGDALLAFAKEEGRYFKDGLGTELIAVAKSLKYLSRQQQELDELVATIHLQIANPASTEFNPKHLHNTLDDALARYDKERAQPFSGSPKKRQVVLETQQCGLQVAAADYITQMNLAQVCYPAPRSGVNEALSLSHQFAVDNTCDLWTTIELEGQS